jgi:hypothetical protein
MLIKDRIEVELVITIPYSGAVLSAADVPVFKWQNEVGTPDIDVSTKCPSCYVH